MDRTTQIEELYLAFAKSQSQIDELYEKLPLVNWSRPKPSSMTTAEQLIAMQRETYQVKKHTDMDLSKMKLFANKMYEMDLKYIELEKMAIAQTKRFWEERMIPSIPAIERLTTETEYCETILTDIEALNELETSGLLQQIPNAELEKKRIEWISFLHRIKDRIKSQLLSDDDIRTMDENITLLENTLEIEKHKYEQKVELKTNLESYLNNPMPALKEAIETISNDIVSVKTGIKRTELMIEHKKIKKMYFSGFKDYIQNLNNCIDKSIEKNSMNCYIDPKSFHIIS
jgi:hypothetical protein